ncbi:obg-like ATPase 1 isoform X2 [Syngnathus acus]|uniref:obg-like ATPase 1 isoform X2 n=1 Tax=Syngnathus acus TaxID=161584 RepID=UPI001885D456|nr:obg-like ATPase 1 isoform X2 [Syngnathus acus]
MSHFPCPERSSHLYGDDYRYSDRREAISIGQLKFGSFSKCVRCSWMLQWNSEADEGLFGSSRPDVLVIPFNGERSQEEMHKFVWQHKRKELRLHRLQEKIHSDSVKGFSVALVMKFQDFKEEGSQSAVKADNC